MEYPIEKYKIITTDNMVIAVSTYAGKPVKGVAKCDPRDKFDIEKGKELAVARCARKVSEKRAKRAKKKYAEAVEASKQAFHHMLDMQDYLIDSNDAFLKARDEVKDLLAKM